MPKTEMRLDPLTRAWTLFSEARSVAPAFASARAEADEGMAPDPFLRGRERFAPQTLHQAAADDGWQVRVVPNRAPVATIEGDATPHPDGFYDRMDGVGAHEVVIETAGPEPLEDLPLGGIQKVIAAWKFRMLDLMRDPRLRSFTVVKNVGRAAGGTAPHAVSQVVALAVVPPLLKRKLEIAREFYVAKKRSIFEDLLHEEVRTGRRLVYENNGFAVLCPYASRAPFELAIYPKRQCPDFHGLSDQELAQLSDALRTVLRKLMAALDHAPYNLLLHTAPSRTKRPDQWTTIERDFRWHIEIVPRLQPIGGIELATGCWVNGVWPEDAAEYLRSVEAPEPEVSAPAPVKAEAVAPAVIVTGAVVAAAEITTSAAPLP
jgi:UDPglucose--hexose-1-phosphate uridylyltransferase